MQYATFKRSALWAIALLLLAPSAWAQFVLTAPADNAINQDVGADILFDWADADGTAACGTFDIATNDYYRLELTGPGLAGGAFGMTARNASGGSARNVPASTFEYGSTYTWEVIARDGDTNADLCTSTSAFTFTARDLNVTAPADAAAGVGFDATFTWEAYDGSDVADLDHYEVTVTGGSPNTTITLDGIAAATTSLGLGVDLLVPGAHTVTVVPKNAADVALLGTYGTNSFTTVPAPVLTGAMGNGATEVQLEATFTWEAYAPATDYTLEITGTAGRDAGSVYSFEVAGATTFSYGDPSDLDYGSTYRWTVKPRLDDESEVWTYASWTFTTIDGPPLTAPLNTLTGLPSEPTFTWDTVNGSTAYRFYLSDDPAFGTTMLDAALNTPAAPSFIEVAPVAHAGSHRMQILRDKHTDEATFLIAPGGDVAYATLDNATVYYWRVTSVQGGKEIPSATYSFRVNEAAKPVLNDPSDGEDKTILPLTFDWHVPQNVDALRWRIQVRAAGVTDWLPANMTIDQSGLGASEYTSGTNADPLLRDVDYEWRVISHTSAQPIQLLTTVSDSDVQTFRVRGGSDTDVYPSWPTGGATVYTNTPRLAYFVTEPGDDLTYAVQVRKASDPDWTTPEIDETGIAVFFYDVLAGALDPGADYLWRVRAEYAAGGTFSAWSADQAFTTNGAGTPTQPILSFPGDGATVYNTTVSLDWYLAAQEAGLDYVVSFGPQGGPFIDTVSPTTNLTVNGLTPGATYEWSVISRSTADHAIVSAASSTFEFTVSGGVGDGTPTASYPSGGATVYSRLPEFNWYVEGDLAGITGYIVQWAEAGTGFAAPTSVNIAGAGTKSYTLVGGQELNWGGMYEWRVASVDAGGQSAWSTESFEVTAERQTLRPFVSYPANGEVFKGTSVTVSWYIDQNAAPVQDYVVQYSRTTTFDPADRVTKVVPKTRTFETLTGLVPGATYQWRVRARLTDGQSSGWSNPIGGFVLEAGSAAPVPLVGSPINNVLVRASAPSLAWATPVSSTSELTYDVDLSTSPSLTNPIRARELPSANAVLGTLEPGTYYWRVRTVASSGHVSDWSQVATFRVGVVSTDVEDAAGGELPKEFALATSFPNPFSATTTIGYDVPQASDVRLTVYNALGQRVRTLARGMTEAGTHTAEWDGRDDSGAALANGLYIYRLETGSKQITRTLLLVR